jgi:hypothetical protein
MRGGENVDSLRSVLLALEESLPVDGVVSLVELRSIDGLRKYDHSSLNNAVISLHTAGCILLDEKMNIESLTWKGHTLIDNFRDDRVWQYVIKHANSIDELVNVSETYLMRVLSNEN